MIFIHTKLLPLPPPPMSSLLLLSTPSQKKSVCIKWVRFTDNVKSFSDHTTSLHLYTNKLCMGHYKVSRALLVLWSALFEKKSVLLFLFKLKCVCSERNRNLLCCGIELLKVGISKMSTDSGIELPHPRIARAVIGCRLWWDRVGGYVEFITNVSSRNFQFEGINTRPLKNVNWLTCHLIAFCEITNTRLLGPWNKDWMNAHSTVMGPILSSN